LSKQLADLISAHGYWIVAIIVAVESMGIPAPGETALVTAAIFAGTTHRLDIVWVILAAAVGAIVGDNIGYMLGRRFGYALLLRYGKLVRIDEKRIKLGQYLFRRHGGKVVFFGRFIALLRIFAGPLAGALRMPYRRFLAANVLGALVWAGGTTFLVYSLGTLAEQWLQRFAWVGLAVAVVVGVLASRLMHHRIEQAVESHAAELAAKTPQPAPGDVPPAG